MFLNGLCEQRLMSLSFIYPQFLVGIHLSTSAYGIHGFVYAHRCCLAYEQFLVGIKVRCCLVLHMAYMVLYIFCLVLLGFGHCSVVDRMEHSIWPSWLLSLEQISEPVSNKTEISLCILRKLYFCNVRNILSMGRSQQIKAACQMFEKE